MRVLFVGGLLHGTSDHIADDLKQVEYASPADGRLKAGSQTYEVRRWADVDAAHGFDALCVNSFVYPSEFEAKVRDALDMSASTTTPRPDLVQVHFTQEQLGFDTHFFARALRSAGVPIDVQGDRLHLQVGILQWKAEHPYQDGLLAVWHRTPSQAGVVEIPGR